MDYHSFVIDQLTKTGRRFIDKGAYVLCICPSHAGGNENNPSRKINISGDKYTPLESWCWACSSSDGKQKLSWNELAALTGMAPIRDEAGDIEEEGDSLWLSLPTPDDFYGVKSEEIRHFPWKGNWRGIEESILLKAGASVVNAKDEPRLYLPVTIDGEEVGNIQCVIKVTKESHRIKYLLSKDNHWTRNTLYPIDLAFPMAEKLGFICIVEGARDALRLIQWGVPAVCTCGTNNYTRAKRDSLEELGVRVVIATDDDEAGDKLRDKIDYELKTYTDLKVSHLRFTDGTDPGQLSRSEVLHILRAFSPKHKAQADKLVDSLLDYFYKLRS